ncbi:sugar transferase [Salisediminibacterium halotolerans]|uniref:Exopolysaccharide biosynthesis polyprenyl glycosylphosphotransferase n=1 Tax=Salisediminibacterium halotolerans TaxID=517425 RepID=A0A1H9TXF8_9BACI|nr:sugar transferase [Salisediminibacterium haloalkalitolerans]SES01443.1 exopolysaccharide biosynthesis polyprenyl glycosylphosphotransferase [Salisediminibacterium haloalkalitolerans]
MTNMGESRNHRLFLITADLLLVLIAYISAFYVRYFDFPGRNWDAFISLLPWILLIALFFIAVYELYSLDQKHQISDIMRKTIVAVAMMTFLTMAASYLFREFAMPRSVVLIASVFSVVLIVVFKTLYLKITRGKVVGRVLLIGNEHNLKKMTNKIKHPMLRGTKVIHAHGTDAIDKIDHLLQRSDYAVLCTDISKETKSQIIYHAMERNKNVYVIPTLYELLLQRAATSPLEDTMVMGVKPFGLTWDKVFVKRVLDIIGSGLLILLASPVFAFVSVIVKLEDRKSEIIFKQERLGKNDKPFMMYKFRSMISGAENQTGPVLASADDDRITKVGHFIRSTRLDELPQLINVLKGDMSLVGPRPEREFFTRQLAQKYYHYGYRNRVKPGVTGYAQVMGKYSTEVEDKLRFDLYYIRNYSLWLDVVILLKTFLVIFEKSKSEGTSAEDEEGSSEEDRSSMNY